MTERGAEGNERVVRGQTVRQYAAIYAATAEGFPLDLVLENARIPEDAWPEIDAAWSEALADDIEKNGTLSEEFDRALIALAGTYRRAIPPLDDDLGAWLAFVRAWSNAEEPDAFLRQRGIESTDMLRLHRDWSQRLADDPALRAKAAALVPADGAPPPVVPRPEPLQLKSPLRRGTGTQKLAPPSKPRDATPSLLAPLPTPEGSDPIPVRRPPTTIPPAFGIRPLIEIQRTMVGIPALVVDTGLAEESSSFDAVRLPDDFEIPPPESLAPKSISEELTLAQYASMQAEIEVYPDREEAIHAKYGVAAKEKRVRVDAVWQKRLSEQTETFAEWRVLHRHFVEHWEQVARQEG